MIVSVYKSTLIHNWLLRACIGGATSKTSLAFKFSFPNTDQAIILYGIVPLTSHSLHLHMYA